VMRGEGEKAHAEGTLFLASIVRGSGVGELPTLYNFPTQPLRHYKDTFWVTS
jgi:hypothetical protein